MGNQAPALSRGAVPGLCLYTCVDTSEIHGGAQTTHKTHLVKTLSTLLVSGVCGASGHHPPHACGALLPCWPSALGCSCWGPRTYLGAAATGLSAEVKEVPALLQVQRPQVVLKRAPRKVLWKEQQVSSVQPVPGTPRCSL